VFPFRSGYHGSHGSHDCQKWESPRDPGTRYATPQHGMRIDTSPCGVAMEMSEVAMRFSRKGVAAVVQYSFCAFHSLHAFHSIQIVCVWWKAETNHQS
jgi:hypothetical protein